MLLRPLFYTSWLLDDFIADAGMFGAELAVLSSASSRTASALAYLLSRRDGISVVGLTSAANADFVDSLGVYDVVVTYDRLDQLPAGRAVYVDMSGNAAARAGVHAHFGSELAHSAVVGATHYEQMGEVPDGLPGPRPTFFFAPDRVAQRSRDWGMAALEGRIADSWRPYVEWSQGWLRVVRDQGEDAVRSTYLELLDGHSDPAVGHVLTLAT